jgi:hypothetical protein
LIQSPTIQRASQRLIFSIAPSLATRGIRLWLRDVTQAYTQSNTPLQRLILAKLPKELRNRYPAGIIMVIVKPLYGVAKAGAYWFVTYFKHHIEQLRMAISTYDPCLLVTTNEADGFGVVGLQTDDSLDLSDDIFATKETKKMSFKAKEKQFLNSQNPIIFNGCILTIGDNNVLSLGQKNQAQKLQIVQNEADYVQQRARGAYIATICQPEASYDLSVAVQSR